MKDDNKVTNSINNVLELFRTGNVPQTLIIATFPKANHPSGKWSLTNKLIMLLSGTEDARGIKQWNSVGRRLKKDCHAIYILAPRKITGDVCVKCNKITQSKNDEEKKCFCCGGTKFQNDKKTILSGFLGIPVFRKEDTDGEALLEEKIVLPDFDFLEVAKKWNIEVKPSLFNGSRYGCFRYNEQIQEIILASPDESVFFHELAHAAHKRTGKLRKSFGQNADNEIVAEFVAAVLCEMSGKKSNLGNSYQYIERYAKELNLLVDKAVLKLLSEIEDTLKIIFEEKENITNVNEESQSVSIEV